MFLAAHHMNLANILCLCSDAQDVRILDLGCDDGEWTLQVAKASGAREIQGIELNSLAAEKAVRKGIKVSISDLNQRFPYADDTFDLIHTNQVIEHVPNVDHFLQEIFRVLRPGGSLVLSTENGSSWHNVLAAAMGWQIFSLTNLSSRQSGIGNPLAVHRGTTQFTSTWTHKVIFNYLGLVEFLQIHGFRNLVVRGAGYYPFPAILGKWDPRHGHFLAVRAEKPLK